VQRWVDEGDGHRYLEPKNLEDLGEGREKARQYGEVITIKEKWVEFHRRRRTRFSSPEAS
jgi:MFS transporter, PHS family, inorganic phosphate transporter